jgi:two-component system sensor histidine kinase AlgZ
VLLHVLALGPLAAFDWRALATGSLFVQWNALLCLALLCRLRGQLLRLSPAAATAACLTLVMVVSALSSVIVFRFYPLLGPDSGGVLDWVLRNALLALLLAAIVLRYSYLQQRVASQQRSELQLRLDALRARIRPHFLFNTLNSIASLIAVQPERAEQAIEDVAELFRAALQADAQDSTLAQECRLCELYLAIEQLRLGERLSVRWDMDDALRDIPLPALLLQPLVENAVYHGIAQIAAGGTVRIAASRAGASMVLEVENPVPERRSSGTSGNRMALDNIRQRLAAQYGYAASLVVGQSEGTYRAAITLPLDRDVRL